MPCPIDHVLRFCYIPVASTFGFCFVVRAEKKQLTRQALLNAALDLMESGRGFCSLSLREVTRQTGIVPAAFYRHFSDMDELGLALVDEVSLTFRAAIRAVRHHEIELGGAIDASVRIFLDHVDEHRRLFLFLAREQYGGSPVVRQAIAAMGRQFIADLAADLIAAPKLQHLSPVDIDILADLIVKTVFATVPELIDPPRLGTPSHADPKTRLIHKLRFIMIGAKHWRGIAPPAEASH